MNQPYQQQQGNGFGFDINQYEAQQAFDNLPNAWYNVVVSSAEIQQIGDTANKKFSLEHTVYGGPFNGRKLFDNLNIFHTSDQAQEIARRTLRTIQDSLGRPINGPLDVLNQYLCVKVGIDKPKRDASDAEKAAHEPRNVIRGYKPFSQELAAQNQQGQAQGYNVQVSPVGNGAPNFNQQQPQQYVQQSQPIQQQPQQYAQQPAPQQAYQQPPVQQQPPQQQYQQPPVQNAPQQYQQPPQNYQQPGSMPGGAVNSAPPAHQQSAPAATAQGGPPSQGLAAPSAEFQAAPPANFAPQSHGAPGNVPPPGQQQTPPPGQQQPNVSPSGNVPPPSGNTPPPPQQQNYQQQPPQGQPPQQQGQTPPPPGNSW